MDDAAVANKTKSLRVKSQSGELTEFTYFRRSLHLSVDSLSSHSDSTSQMTGSCGGSLRSSG